MEWAFLGPQLSQGISAGFLLLLLFAVCVSVCDVVVCCIRVTILPGVLQRKACPGLRQMCYLISEWAD